MSVSTCALLKTASLNFNFNYRHFFGVISWRFVVVVVVILMLKK